MNTRIGDVSGCLAVTTHDACLYSRAILSGVCAMCWEIGADDGT